MSRLAHWPDDPHWFERVAGSLRCPNCESGSGQPAVAVGRLVCPECEHEWAVEVAPTDESEA